MGLSFIKYNHELLPFLKTVMYQIKQLEVRVGRKAVLGSKHLEQDSLTFMDGYTGKSLLCAQGNVIWEHSTILDA